jgi:D-beta-D-heptose 7-phosphate kinase/D-beta-D-heptose 1-phosphate adenosyltransferase
MIKGLPALLKKISRRRIVVVGDVMLDHYQWGDATRISPEAPVPVVRVARETDTIGGAANVASNVAALGASVEIVGAVGRDASGDKLRSRFQELGIAFDDRLLLGRGMGRTITKTRVVVRNQQLCRLDFEDAPSAYRSGILGTPEGLALIESKIAGADAVILSDYAKGVLTTGFIAALTRLARKHGAFIALDPKPAGGSRFYGVDLLTPNRREAIELSGLHAGPAEEFDPPGLCAAIWKKFRPRNLVVTMGADGMLISLQGSVVRAIPTAARQVYDVSGAGDTVIAALTLALTSGCSLERAAHFANAAAGVVVGKIGTATVTPDELAAYVG